MKLPYRNQSGLIVPAVVSISSIALVWSFRFLPLYDYPIWLYETHILSELSSSASAFSSCFETVGFPVPNLGFVGTVWLFSWFVSLEVAGKMFLTLCVVGFPWSFWYCARTFSSESDPVIAYLAFPYTFNLYFFGGHSFLLGLIVLFFTIGYFFPKLGRLSPKEWGALSLVIFVSCLVHALSFFILILALFGFLLFQREERWRRMRKACVAILPSAILLLWYALAEESRAQTQWTWDLWTLGQNLLKAPFLFIKSYGLENQLPLTVLNVAWLATVLFILGKLLWRSLKQKSVVIGFIPAVAVLLLLIAALPGSFLGVIQPAARLGIPFMLLVALLTTGVAGKKVVRNVFLLTAFLVVAYNAFHFHRVNQQMTRFTHTLEEHVEFDRPFYIVGFDWPAHTTGWDIGSASVNPLFGAPYYTLLKREGTSWIMGTGLLRMRDDCLAYAPVLRGTTAEMFEASVLSNVDRLTTFATIVITGRRSSARKLEAELHKAGYATVFDAELFSILMEGGTRPVTE